MLAMPAFLSRIKHSLSTLAAPQDSSMTPKLRLGSLLPARRPQSRLSKGIDVHITDPSLHIGTRDYVELESQTKE